MRNDIPVDEVRRRFNYDPETGDLTWAIDRCSWLPAGSRAGYVNNGTGYRTINFGGRKYSAHRLIWVLIYGEWPSQQLDHINGIRHDNRKCNLRLASHSQNILSGRGRLNASGYRGVVRHQRRNKWKAVLRINGKPTTVSGWCDTPEDAHAAYMVAAQKHHGEFAPVRGQVVIDEERMAAAARLALDKEQWERSELARLLSKYGVPKDWPAGVRDE